MASSLIPLGQPQYYLPWILPSSYQTSKEIYNCNYSICLAVRLLNKCTLTDNLTADEKLRKWGLKSHSRPTVNSFGEIYVEFFVSLNFCFGSLKSILTLSFLLSHCHLISEHFSFEINNIWLLRMYVGSTETSVLPSRHSLCSQFLFPLSMYLWDHLVTSSFLTMFYLCSWWQALAELPVSSDHDSHVLNQSHKINSHHQNLLG